MILTIEPTDQIKNKTKDFEIKLKIKNITFWNSDYKLEKKKKKLGHQKDLYLSQSYVEAVNFDFENIVCENFIWKKSAVNGSKVRGPFQPSPVWPNAIWFKSTGSLKKAHN